jgi:hypothetical protein
MIRNHISLLSCFFVAGLSLNCSSETSAGVSASGGGGTTGAAGDAPSSGAGGSAAPALGGSGSGGEPTGPGVGGLPGGGADGDGTAGTSEVGGSAGAGTAGVAGTTGTAGAGPSAVCPAGALLCDDFESYTLNTAPSGKWKVTNVGLPTTVVDDMHAFSGTKAAHFHGKVDNNRQYTFMTAEQAPIFPVASEKLFVRFMLLITQWPSSTATHTRLAWVGTTQALSTPQQGFDGAGYVLCNYNGVAIERLDSGFFRNTATNLREPTRVGKWACFEMEIDNTGGPPPGGVGAALPHIFEADKEYTLALAGDKSVAWNGVKFEALQFSLWSPQTDTVTADYWIDDVVMSTQHIGCPAQ